MEAGLWMCSMLLIKMGTKSQKLTFWIYIYKALRPDSSNFGYSIRRSVGVKSAMVHIVIELIRFDKPGLLSELSALLTHLKCNVVSAEVSTDHAQLRAMPVQILGEERCIEVGDYGFPCLGVLLQKLENPALRSCLKVPSNEGVLVRRVELTSGASKVLKEVCLFLVLFVYPFVINGVLTDLNLTISKAYISSDGGWFVNVFNVTDQGMNEITEVDVLDYIYKLGCF
ncbi:hypothetical protein POM88_022249 [Heracleum sosnowskyi]|uniref:ACT domain-containing protein ACR n=1 Tax=Heracleum sosnowskyi TaxID=360622 RepID=A0AAD8MTH8_9APIA|nr:hypothetical protein POM88_022249 [Heracleum sosnowskyi]